MLLNNWKYQTGCVRRQAIIWTNAVLLLFGPLGTNFSEIFIEIKTFPLTKIKLKMSSAQMAVILSRPQYVKSISDITIHARFVRVESVSDVQEATSLPIKWRSNLDFNSLSGNALSHQISGNLEAARVEFRVVILLASRRQCCRRADTLFKFVSDAHILTYTRVASRLPQVWCWDVLSLSEKPLVGWNWCHVLI